MQKHLVEPSDTNFGTISNTHISDGRGGVAGFWITKQVGLVLIILFALFYSSCRKPTDPQAQLEPKKPMTSSSSGRISLWDVYQKLPQTIAYNLVDSIRFDTSRVEWIYRQTGLLARIPTGVGTKKWIYVFQPYDDPANIKVYAVAFYQENSSATNFTGKQIWIDLQDWHGYGVSYTNNRPDGFLQPQKLTEPGWETCMMNHGDFYLDNGKIRFQNGQQAGTGMRPTGGPDGCGGLIGPERQSLWDMLGRFFGKVFTPGPGKGGPWEGFGSAPGVWIPPNGLGGGEYGGGGGGGGSSPYEPPPADPEIIPVPPDQAGTTFNTVDNPGQTVPALWDIDGPITTNGNNNQLATVENATVAFVGAVLNLNQQQRNWLLQHLDKAASIQTYLLSIIPNLSEIEKKDVARDHITMMMENQDYLALINNLTTNWWVQDQNNFILARKLQMEVYFQAKPFAAIDCEDLLGIDNHWESWQSLGSYQISPTASQRVTDIRNTYPSRYTLSNFHVQNISDAKGAVVNCDYFALHISELPFDTYGQFRMTPKEFLDFFRKNINTFDDMGDNTSVLYSYYNDPGYQNDYTKFYSDNEAAHGVLAHFHNPAAVALTLAYNDGTVLESGYEGDAAHKWFVYTTMAAPLDGQHPVSGNRRFGILPDPSNGGYTFYIRGVDRTTDRFTTVVNDLLGSVFAGADDLWNSDIKGLKSYIEQHGGTANYYSTGGTVIRRLDWNGGLGDFLKGDITFQQLKDQNNCD